MDISSENFESPVDDSDIDEDYYPSEDEDNSGYHENNVLRSTEDEDSDNSDDVLNLSKRSKPNSPEKHPKSRRRQSNVEYYSRSKRKHRRNLGQAYVSDKTNKMVTAREIGPPCGCKKNCRAKLEGFETEIFNKFWDLGSWELQNSYLFDCIEIVGKKRFYPKKRKRQQSSRSSNAFYSVMNDGQEVCVCKKEFLHVHGLQSSKGRLNNLVSKKIQGAPLPEKDGRGKHISRPSKITEDKKQTVRDHINSIPKYQSHYSRNGNLGKVYLDCDMTIASLYKEKYVQWCQESEIQPVAEHTYLTIFCSEYNIGFKLPKSDTCKTCDELNIKIEVAKLLENNESEVNELNAYLNLHKAKAKVMQDLLKQETEESKTDTKKCVISFDLQQALPNPKLTTGPAFYCRKIWMYNLGVHDCTNGKGFMFVWTEDQAKRGAHEIASVILKFLSTKPDVENLVIFTDNCPGQNKNWLLMSLWLQLVKEKRFKIITHHYLVSGHTHLPSDRDFALIEKRHRKYAPIIYSPSDWHQVIRDANKKQPFELTIMDRTDFLSFQPILNNIKKNLRTEDNDNLNFSNAFSFQFRTENTKVIYLKYTVNGEYITVNVTKKGRPVQTLIGELGLKYPEAIKIAKNKLNNVKSLLPYVPPMHHPFYLSLQCQPEGNAPLDEAENTEIME